MTAFWQAIKHLLARFREDLFTRRFGRVVREVLSPSNWIIPEEGPRVVGAWLAGLLFLWGVWTYQLISLVGGEHTTYGQIIYGGLLVLQAGANLLVLHYPTLLDHYFWPLSSTLFEERLENLEVHDFLSIGRQVKGPNRAAVLDALLDKSGQGMKEMILVNLLEHYRKNDESLPEDQNLWLRLVRYPNPEVRQKTLRLLGNRSDEPPQPAIEQEATHG